MSAARKVSKRPKRKPKGAAAKSYRIDVAAVGKGSRATVFGLGCAVDVTLSEAGAVVVTLYSNGAHAALMLDTLMGEAGQWVAEGFRVTDER